jgi:hypothetical protein
MLNFQLNDGTWVIAEINSFIDDDGIMIPTLSNLVAFDGQLTADQLIEAEQIAWDLIDKMD